MSEKSSSNNAREDVLQFLETLDTYSQTAPTQGPATADDAAKASTDTKAVLEFLDKIAQTGGQPGSAVGGPATGAPVATATAVATPAATSVSGASANASPPAAKSKPATEKGAVSGTTAGESVTGTNEVPAAENTQPKQHHEQPPFGNWSWGDLLTSASSAYKTASTVVDSSVKNALATVETVRSKETTKKLEERVRGYVNKETIEKIGADLKTIGLTIVNAVAAPIGEYEVVEVWLTHDMVGYVGVEHIVSRAWVKVMEQVEGGDVVVRKGNEARQEDEKRNLNVCEGFVEAVKLSKANIEQLIKKNYNPGRLAQEQAEALVDTAETGYPVSTTCPVFMAIQPFKASPALAPVPAASDPSSSADSQSSSDSNEFLFYAIVLTDPTHDLTFKTFSQALPAAWLDIPYEENEWVEGKMVEAIRLSVGVVAQDYVWHRMTAVTAATKLNDDSPDDGKAEGRVQQAESRVTEKMSGTESEVIKV